MKWNTKLLLVLSSLVTWFAVAAIYNEIGFDMNPDGMFRALTGAIFVGPAVSLAIAWVFVTRFKQERKERKNRQLVATMLLLPIGLIALAQYITT